MEDLPDKTDTKRNANIPLLSIVAIVLSVGALLVSVFEVSAIRDEQRIQVWPYVSITANYSGDGYTLAAVNKGIGPARVRDVEILYDGTTVTDIDQLILDTLGAEDAFSYEVYKASDIRRSVLSPEEERFLFSVPWEPRTQRLAQDWSDKIDILVCFCSVYDDCWEARLNAGEPVSVPRCEAE